MDGERPGTLGALHHKNRAFLGVFRETEYRLCTDHSHLMLPEKGDSASVRKHTPTTVGNRTSALEGALLRSLFTAFFGTEKVRRLEASDRPQVAEQPHEEVEWNHGKSKWNHYRPS